MLDLSSELLEEILLRVPAKSLKLTCKQFFECDGLLVWVMEHNLLILNPLLRRGTIVPVPPPCCGYDYCNYAYGLGYVTNPRSSNDYKIVKFSCDSTRKLYDFKSQSWNEVFDKIFDGFFNVPMSSVCFRGTPYWTGVFKVDYISLLHRSSLTGEIHLWVKKQQWSMMMTVVIPEATMFHMHSSYLIENNSKLVVMAGSCHFETKSVTIYVAGENEEFQKVEYRCGTNSMIDGCYYVPSLIKVPGFSEPTSRSHSVSLTPTKQSKSLALHCSNNGDNISSPKDTPIELTFPTVMDTNQIREILPHSCSLSRTSLSMTTSSLVISLIDPSCIEPEVGGSQDNNFFFAGIDKVRFRKPVIAGDTLVMRMTLVKFQKRFGLAKMEGKAYVGLRGRVHDGSS
ncbi:hypothetical protein DY000_02057237 [Brassica cretica]|uniref:F-box associated beta-propeller type 1 domain-containing protein n=1 Tax=Brassica cretica TaxID=69181 RepID=A0ABQ7ACK4_BRACR|nr:hypothetical protein DY000_02057237 [Brassica cretica]